VMVSDGATMFLDQAGIRAVELPAKLAEPGTGLKMGYFLGYLGYLYADIALVAADAAYASLLSIQFKISSAQSIVFGLAMSYFDLEEHQER
jgi:hypothetical protein